MINIKLYDIIDFSEYCVEYYSKDERQLIWKNNAKIYNISIFKIPFFVICMYMVFKNIVSCLCDNELSCQPLTTI